MEQKKATTILTHTEASIYPDGYGDVYVVVFKRIASNPI